MLTPYGGGGIERTEKNRKRFSNKKVSCACVRACVHRFVVDRISLLRRSGWTSPVAGRRRSSFDDLSGSCGSGGHSSRGAGGPGIVGGGGPSRAAIIQRGGAAAASLGTRRGYRRRGGCRGHRPAKASAAGHRCRSGGSGCRCCRHQPRTLVISGLP